MKRILFVFVLFVVALAVNAQEVEKSFADFKNEGNAAIRSKDYPKALDAYEKQWLNGETNQLPILR
ncbi:MAG: hypothetical protein PHP53_13055 [Prolixibacteraceae bacterium]|nr:hypothetical protein [Prolixibacteraceae bacterium]